MSTYKTYTGTFVKQDGSRRTMNFVKVADLPESIRPKRATGTQIHGNGSQVEVVWDTDARGFRTFNHGTVVGSIINKNMQISFDKNQ